MGSKHNVAKNVENNLLSDQQNEVESYDDSVDFHAEPCPYNSNKKLSEQIIHLFK